MANDVETGLLRRFGESSALALSSQVKCSGRIVAKRASEDLKLILTAARGLRGKASEVEREWLRDNYYVAEKAAAFVRECFSRIRGLPSAPKGRVPLVYAAAERFVFCGGFSEERLDEYLTGFQNVRPLSERELSLLFPALHAALLKKLALAASRARGLQEKTEENAAHEENALELKAVFEAFRAISEADASKLLLRQSSVERIFSADPVYRGMDDPSRAQYRRRLAKLAEREGVSESALAQSLIDRSENGRASHVGALLFSEPSAKKTAVTLAVYLFAIIGLSAIASLSLCAAARCFVLLPLVSIPLTEIFKSAADSFAAKIKRPRPLPRMELKNGVPAEAATLAVISCLPRNAAEASDLVRKLELYSLANRDAGSNLFFGLLADLPSSSVLTAQDDEAILSACADGINALNERYGGRFFAFTRPRGYDPGTGTMCGRERKRGAVESLVGLICGRASEIAVSAGPAEKTARLKYLILLDSDTKLTIGSAKKLVGTMLHPSARPAVDEKKKKVVSGHGIVAPAIGVDLDSSNASRFAAIFGGRGGTEPYAFARSDVYQDLFGRGSFAGKGIVDVEAYDKCLFGRFPLNTVLSHDLPEGELLRCGFADDIELTDGFPSSPRSYLLRLHRWTRGDWQNCIWLGKRVKNSAGEKSANAFDGLSRWKIFDDLRRSLFAPACLISFLAAFFLGGAFSLAGAAAAAALLFPAVIAAANSALRAKKGREYRSRVLYGAGEAVIYALASFALLPQTALTELSAAVTAVYRLAVSKKRLLSWTSAAETESGDNSFPSTLKTMLPAVFIGTAALFSSPPGAACGLIWLLSPVFAFSLASKRKKPRLDRADKSYLRKEAASIWSYFSELMTNERGFLPPDNWQEEPALGPAERTSPTNIGLAVLSALAASELSFISRGEACGVCERIAETLKKLEKKNGHLYNWYDLKTMRPMEPRYVSTVDSGNLAACLTAAAAMLKRYGREDLARRLTLLRDAMDFRELYDFKRELFCIGINASGEREGLYDLFASEARLTSYYAAARGICPPKHWHALGRPMARAGERVGVASWNGSVFEYFMPELLLPLYENSLVWESLRFCAAVQLAAGRPWGASESAFASLDETGSYRYKAHGAQNAALKRKVYADKLAAPYASFLALSLWPKTAVRNLRRFDSLGAKGRFGFYEALDYTEKRLPAGEKFVPVKTFMAHHLGMSLVAAANAVKDGVFVKAFLDDPEQAAFTELLQEKGPVGSRVTTADGGDVEKRILFDGPWESAADEDGLPRAAVLSNGAYSLTLTSDGLWSSSCGDIALTLFDETGRNSGMFVKAGDKILPLTGAKPDGATRRCRLSEKEAVFISEFEDFSVESSWYVPEKLRGEVRRVRISNAGAGRKFELSIYLKPVLSEASAYLAHPAFSKLSIETRAFSKGTTVIRRPGGAVRPSAMSVAVSEPFGSDTSREHVVGRFGSVENALKEPAASTAGAVLDPCVLLRCPVNVPSGQSREIVFSIAWGEDADSAESAAAQLVSVKSRPSGFNVFAARECGLISADRETVGGLLLSMLYRSAGETPGADEKAGIDDLWRIGVSGDHPTAYVEAKDAASLEKAKAFMRAAKFLRMCSFMCDLVVSFDEPDGYTRPVSSALYEEYEALGRPNVIHIAGMDAARGVKNVAARAGAAAYRPPLGKTAVYAARERNSHFEDGAFVFETEQSAGMPAWSHIMTNGSLGWLAADAGTFGLWLDNARENRLVRWINDPLSSEGAEKLCLVRAGREVSLFAARDEYGCRITYAPGYAVWERRIGATAFKTTGCVHYRDNVRILEIRADDTEPGDLIRWRIEPFPCERRDGIRPVATGSDGRCVVYRDHETGQKLTAVFSEDISVLHDGAVEFRPRERTTIFLSTGAEPCGPVGALEETVGYWKEICSHERYSTPFPELNDYLNGWNLYQILACRIMGRASLYQTGGAIGFRDQLQDVVSVADLFPEIARRQILEAAEHQYEAGDVMHWWHRGLRGERDRGVRTRCSDDLLWLAWAACRFAEITGDLTIFDASCAWLESEPLADGEKDRYEPAFPTENKSTLFEHCLRAVRLVEKRGCGGRGLLKIGSGDWNDGMDRVGAGGKGESVWLTFFAAYVSRELGEAAQKLGRSGVAEELRGLAAKWGEAADSAFEFDRYLRGTYDDGTPLGSRASAECSIDSLPQSWAVLSGFGSRDKCETALDTALKELCGTDGVIKLFAPPFDGRADPGYIRAYLPGVRENGGGYTHAAIWLAMALFKLGRDDEGTRILLSLLPPANDPRYKLEPYVLAGDVYSNPQHCGRGGWSWYTGSAGWFRTAVRDYLLPALEAKRRSGAPENNSPPHLP